MSEIRLIHLFCGALILICGWLPTLAQTSNNSSSQPDIKLQEIKDKITKIGIGSDITIIDKNSREFYGSVSEIKDYSVVINEIDQKVKIEIEYTRINKVRKNYGAAKSWNGKRIPTRKHIIGIAIAATAAIVLPVILVASAKD